MLPPFLAYASKPLLERYGEGVEERLKVRHAAAPRRAARSRALRSVRSSGSHAPRSHRPQLNPLRRGLAFSFVLAEKYRVRGRARRLRSPRDVVPQRLPPGAPAVRRPTDGTPVPCAAPLPRRAHDLDGKQLAHAAAAWARRRSECSCRVVG